MDALEFACFFNRFEKLLNLHLEPEIVSLIYSDYNKSFERYTFFELVHILKKHKLSLEYPLNKANIIEKIKKERINVPEIDNETKRKTTEWCVCNTYTEEYDIFYIYLSEYFVSIIKEDIIEFADNIKYKIVDIIYSEEEQWHSLYNNKYVKIQLENLSTHNMVSMTGNEFMNIMDDEDITYVVSKYLSFF